MSRLPRDRRKPNRPKPVAPTPITPTPAGTLPTTAFPKVSLTGGPSPRDVVLLIDGQVPKRAFEAEVSVGVGHAPIVTVWQYAELDIRLAEAEVEDAGYTVTIRKPQTEDSPLIEMVAIAQGKGATIRAAALAALGNLPVDPAEGTH